MEDSHFLASELTTKLQKSKQCDTGIKTDTWNRLDSPEIYPPIYDQMIFDKGIQALQWRKGKSFNKWCWENWIFTYQRVKFDPYLTSCTKINSKWIKDLDVRPKNIKKTIGRNLYNVRYGNDFLDITLKIQITKEKIGTLDFMKRKFCASKDNSKRVIRQPTGWEKIF